MKIERRGSPNFNARRAPVSILVLHYTGMQTGAAAIERLCDPQAGVSAHYVVEEDGRVLQLVDEDQRAWHAGHGAWRGCADVNSASIGIEIVNGGHDFALPPYPERQIEAVLALGLDIVARHGIDPWNVIGHSDLAPDRKADPGERFPWRRMAEAGLGLWPERAFNAPASAEIARLLGEIGYPIDPDDERSVAHAVAAFQRRFRPEAVNGRLDFETGSLVQAVRALCP